MLLFSIVVVILLLTMLLYVMVNKRSSVPAGHKIQFDDCCKQYNLDKSQQRLMRKLAGHHPFEAAPHELFSSGMYFERCMDSAVKLLLLTNVDDEDIAKAEKELTDLRAKTGVERSLPSQHLLSTRNMKAGQKVDLYRSAVSGILCKDAEVVEVRETYMHIKMASGVSLQPGVVSGDEIRVVFSRSGDAVYEFQGEVYRSENESCLDVLHTLNLRRTQLREFVRMEIKTPVNIKLMHQQRMRSTLQWNNKNFEMADLSGGGLSFVSENEFVPGDRLSISFDLPNEKLQGLAGKLLRISEVDERSSKKFRHHVQFYRIEDAQRDKIVRFIFDRQRQSVSAA